MYNITYYSVSQNTMNPKLLPLITYKFQVSSKTACLRRRTYTTKEYNISIHIPGERPRFPGSGARGPGLGHKWPALCRDVASLCSTYKNVSFNFHLGMKCKWVS